MSSRETRSLFTTSVARFRVRWDCMVCRIYRSQGRWYVVGTGLSVPRQELTPLIQQVERESQESGESAAAYVRDNSHRWHRVIRELYEERLAGLCLVNAEGDELEFCAAVYRIEDETALAAALEAAEAFEAESDDGGPRSFAWLEPATSGARRSYGRIELRDGKLRLECNSRQRLSAGRELVETHGGAWLRHLGDSFQSQAAMKREAMQQKPQRKPSPASGLPPQVERDILNRVKREHYARWVDENLPALDGRTPREAAQSQTGRRALEDLLRTRKITRNTLGGKAAPASISPLCASSWECSRAGGMFSSPGFTGQATYRGRTLPRPPSMPRTCPVVQELAGSTRKAITDAMSSGGPIRPSTCMPCDAFSAASF